MHPMLCCTFELLLLHLRLSSQLAYTAMGSSAEATPAPPGGETAGKELSEEAKAKEMHKKLEKFEEPLKQLEVRGKEHPAIVWQEGIQRRPTRKCGSLNPML